MDEPRLDLTDHDPIALAVAILIVLAGLWAAC